MIPVVSMQYVAVSNINCMYRHVSCVGIRDCVFVYPHLPNYDQTYLCLLKQHSRAQTTFAFDTLSAFAFVSSSMAVKDLVSKFEAMAVRESQQVECVREVTPDEEKEPADGEQPAKPTEVVAVEEVPPAKPTEVAVSGGGSARTHKRANQRKKRRSEEGQERCKAVLTPAVRKRRWSDTSDAWEPVTTTTVRTEMWWDGSTTTTTTTTCSKRHRAGRWQ